MVASVVGASVPAWVTLPEISRVCAARYVGAEARRSVRETSVRRRTETPHERGLGEKRWRLITETQTTVSKTLICSLQSLRNSTLHTRKSSHGSSHLSRVVSLCQERCKLRDEAKIESNSRVHRNYIPLSRNCTRSCRPNRRYQVLRVH